MDSPLPNLATAQPRRAANSPPSQLQRAAPNHFTQPFQPAQQPSLQNFQLFAQAQRADHSHPHPHPHPHPGYAPQGQPPAFGPGVGGGHGGFGMSGGRSSPWPNGQSAPGPQSNAGGGPSLGPVPPNDTRTQLYVGNLPFRVRWQDLKDLFRKCGTVLRADVALTPHDGRSRGFGVVLFARAEDAYSAIEKYNGFSWQTRTLDVRLDTQDPTGVLAIAEANRQAAMQQQAQHFQLATLQQAQAHAHGAAWPSPLPLPLAMPSQLAPNAHLPPFDAPPAPPYVVAHHASSLVQSVRSVPSSSANSSPIPLALPAFAQPPAGDATPSATSSTTSTPASDSSAPSSVLSDEKPSLEPRTISAEEPRFGRTSPPTANGSGVSPANGHDAPNLSPNNYPPQNQPPSHQYPPQHHPPSMHFQPPPPMHGGSMAPMMGMPNMGMGKGMGGPPMGGGGGYQSLGGMHQGGMQHGMSQGGPQGGMGGPNMHGGMMPYLPQQQHQRSTSTPVPPGYSNRHLFVGNLPFNCQWQELKDLMRSAGAVLRADIAQGPDGRSRGFGSVLFSSPQDADRAVQMFNGYDYNGRALKVHFDKFSHSPSSQTSPSMFPSQAPQSGMPYMAPHPYEDGHRDHHMSMQSLQDGQRQQGPPDRHPPSNGFPARADQSGPRTATPVGGAVPAPVPTAAGPETPSPKSHGEPPGRITMPPPYPFAGPLSPMQGRLPPMTPSMPAFTLGAFPQTPPVYPMLFSPGLGPFSPPMGQHYGNHFMNAAPGAPIHRQGDGMFGAYDPPIVDSGVASAEATPPASQQLSSLSAEPSYFPPVPAAPTSRSGSTSSGASSSAGDAPSLGASAPISTPPSRSTTPLASFDQLRVSTPEPDKGLEVGWADAPLSVPSVEAGRRKSLVTAGEVEVTRDASSKALNLRRRFEGDTERRASFESSDSRPRPVFGTSIWATNGSAVE